MFRQYRTPGLVPIGATDGESTATIAPKSIEGRFPPVDCFTRLYDNDPGALSISLDAQLLMTLIGALVKSVGADSTGSDTITLTFSADKFGEKPMKVTVDRPHVGARAVGAIMPLNLDR